MSEWFGTWFDSEYYHTLYKDRDYTEAEAFVQKLAEYLIPKADDLILDLACGKGRHSIHLNKMGYTLEGCDYSANSIKKAKESENEKLHFYEHDMRDTLPKQYDYVLNLFTSFGYFKTQEEHLSTLTHLYEGLKENGTLVIDYMNVDYVLQNLVSKETLMIDGIEFYIKRELSDGKIIKHIAFEVEDGWHYHKEKVSALRLDDFTKWLELVGFTLKETFGNYDLQKFDSKTSPRLILVAQK
ncbi:MAG: SAM-dependent methyltransferase [Bacteroidia bacterium]|jgi:SAM-dependent methyltransferase|tara:strand:+ start:1146 stop:1868 length:723 start_codon:yes stop_codon:yes gene_type:complete